MSKRLFDLTVAFFALLVLSPLMLIITVAIGRRMGRPVLFRQLRPGRHGKPFMMVKFRTMRDLVDKEGHMVSDAERLTPFGQWLRASSLDELPELWNVVRGEMSLVGPRPLLMQYLPLYSPEQARRHLVRPGVTGWAQINGRNALSWDEKFALDCWYVDNRSLWLDCKILLHTALKVVKRNDINAPGEATMTAFTGNDRAL